MHSFDVIGVALLLVCLGIYAAGYAHGKINGERKTAAIFLDADDPEEEAEEWDILFVEDGFVVPHPVTPPSLTLIDGGKGKRHE